MTDPEQATIGDLFRLMTEMRSDHSAKLDGLRTDMTEVKTDLTEVKATLADHSVKLDEAASERQAIRAVVDELPTMGSVEAVEDGLKSVKADTEATRREVRQIASEQRKIVSRLDRAKVPV